jgi:predicted porin
MQKQVKPLLAALLGAGLAAGTVHAQGAPEVKFSAFGTIGAVHSSEPNADFVQNVFQTHGAGFSDRTSFNPDSKVAGQMDVVFNPQWSAVVQLVSQQHADNGYTPQVEWANVKYQPTPELSVRAGRIAAPFFLLSDTRLVGYTQHWVRTPVEVYATLPVTSNDGVDVLWKKQIGGASNALNVYAGTSTSELDDAYIKSNPSWGVNDTVQAGDLTLRAGYSFNKVDLEQRYFKAINQGLLAFTVAPEPIGSMAAALAAKYSTQDVKLNLFTLGGAYDVGKWFVQGEYVKLQGNSFIMDSESWYLTGGYRIGRFTPYATYASTKAKLVNEPGLPIPEADDLNAGLNQLLNNEFNAVQNTASVGVRWDFMKNTALKAQYDRVSLGSNSAGRLTNVQPGFTPGGKVNLFSIALDFVF